MQFHGSKLYVGAARVAAQEDLLFGYVICILNMAALFVRISEGLTFVKKEALIISQDD